MDKIMCSFLQGKYKNICTFFHPRTKTSALFCATPVWNRLVPSYRRPLPSGPVLPPSSPVLPPSDIRAVVLGACTLSIEQVVANNGRRTHSKRPVGPDVVGMIMGRVTRNVLHNAAEDA